MRLGTGSQLRLTLAGYLFTGIGILFMIGFLGRAVMGFMGDPERSPFGYLALAWLMVIFIIVGRIVLKMRGDVTEKDTYVARSNGRNVPRTRVPKKWTGRFVGWIFFGVGSTFAMLALSWLPGTPIYGRTLVLGIVFTILGGIVLALTYWALHKSKGDAKEHSRLEGKPMAMLGLIIASLVLLVFFGLAILVLIRDPANWVGALFFLAFPALGIIIFLIVRRSKKKHAEIREAIEIARQKTD
ncbi:MAG: hypothetical protein CMF59_03215 [Leptospiraceae bacterium]|nr:hypothetical protein [Leptospiraceae bacterium]